jgi:hypothetical protein
MSAYRMQVISVIKTASRVQAGETITVRTSSQNNQALVQGWVGTAYLNPAPQAASADGGRQFVLAAPGESLVNLPPAPPSLTFTRDPPQDGQ